MPNPNARERGNCQECTAYGGMHAPEAEFGATVCLRPRDSGKSVCRLPEVGCGGWVRKPAPPPAPVVPIRPWKPLPSDE